MEEIEKLHHLLLLKNAERRGRVGGRYESSAEHVYGCLVLAEYFLPEIEHGLDYLKVLRMLTYHELVEIESGDTFILDKEEVKSQEDRELEASKTLPGRIPKQIGDNFKELWAEYNEGSSPEAKFCQAIDKIEPVLHSLYDRDVWISNRFTEARLREEKKKYFEDFPSIMRLFNEIVRYYAENDYFVE